jgi:hypothetical protein
LILELLDARAEELFHLAVEVEKVHPKKRRQFLPNGRLANAADPS